MNKKYLILSIFIALILFSIPIYSQEKNKIIIDGQISQEPYENILKNIEEINLKNNKLTTDINAFQKKLISQLNDKVELHIFVSKQDNKKFPFQFEIKQLEASINNIPIVRFDTPLAIEKNKSLSVFADTLALGKYELKLRAVVNRQKDMWSIEKTTTINVITPGVVKNIVFNLQEDKNSSIPEFNLDDTNNIEIQDTNTLKIENQIHLIKSQLKYKLNREKIFTNSVININNNNDENNKIMNYKILFNEYRFKNQFEEAIQICTKLINIKNLELFDDKWKMLCSYSFYQESKKNKTNIFKSKLILWSLNPFVTKPSHYNLLSSLFIALSFKNDINAIEYIKNSISLASKNDEYLDKANLILALLYYKLGDKEQALSYMKKSSSNIGLARLYAALENYKEAADYYKNISIDNNEKIKFEYAQFLFKDKKYNESIYLLKNLSQNPYINKISRLIIENILNKYPESKENGDIDLIQLYHVTENDIKFVNQNKENIFPLFTVAKDYGLETKKIKSFKKIYIGLNNLENNLNKNKIKFENILQSIVSEKIKQDYNLINKILLNIDEKKFIQWNKNSKKYGINLKHRNHLLNMITSNINKYDVYMYAIPRLNEIHKSMGISNINNDNEIMELVFLNNEVLKMKLDNSYINNKISLIKNEINYQEVEISNIKTKWNNELNNYYPFLKIEVCNRIKEFQGVVQLSLAEWNRKKGQFYRSDKNQEQEIENNENEWYQSIKKSIDFGIM